MTEHRTATDKEGFDVSHTARIYGVAETARALEISPATLRSSLRPRAGQVRPSWIQEPLGKINGGYVWSVEAVEAMASHDNRPRPRNRSKAGEE